MTPKQIGDQPAFARLSISPCGDQYGEEGMTYRQWLVGMAMQGEIASGSAAHDEIAQRSLSNADAVLAELAKEVK